MELVAGVHFCVGLRRRAPKGVLSRPVVRQQEEREWKNRCLWILVPFPNLCFRRRSDFSPCMSRVCARLKNEVWCMMRTSPSPRWGVFRNMLPITCPMYTGKRRTRRYQRKDGRRDGGSSRGRGVGSFSKPSTWNTGVHHTLRPLWADVEQSGGIR